MIYGVWTPKLRHCLSCHLPLCREVTDLLRLGNCARDQYLLIVMREGLPGLFHAKLSREGGLSFLAKLDSFAFHQQFQASSGPTLFTYSTPKFCWSRKKWHQSPTFGCTLLCKWHASSPFWNPTRQTAWEIPKGGRPVIYITGLNLGPVVATPAMDAVFGVLGALRLLWKSNGLRCVGTSPRSSQNLPEDMLRGRFWKEKGPVTTSPNSLFACWSQPQPRMLSCWIPGGVSTCCRSLQGSGFWNATVCFYRI